MRRVRRYCIVVDRSSIGPFQNVLARNVAEVEPWRARCVDEYWKTSSGSARLYMTDLFGTDLSVAAHSPSARRASQASSKRFFFSVLFAS